MLKIFIIVGCGLELWTLLLPETNPCLTIISINSATAIWRSDDQELHFQQHAFMSAARFLFVTKQSLTTHGTWNCCLLSLTSMRNTSQKSDSQLWWESSTFNSCPPLQLVLSRKCGVWGSSLWAIYGHIKMGTEQLSLVADQSGHDLWPCGR